MIFTERTSVSGTGHRHIAHRHISHYMEWIFTHLAARPPSIRNLTIHARLDKMLYRQVSMMLRALATRSRVRVTSTSL
jgi:hypothetical protein